MEEKGTKTVTMPLHEYEQMRSELANYKRQKATENDKELKLQELIKNCEDKIEKQKTEIERLRGNLSVEIHLYKEIEFKYNSIENKFSELRDVLHNTLNEKGKLEEEIAILKKENLKLQRRLKHRKWWQFWKC